MARARVLDVGNCDPDHGAIRRMIVNHFDAQVDRVMFPVEALARLSEARYDLVLVNRLIFADDSDGLALIKAMREHGFGDLPVMLVSNFAEAQTRAVAAGAQRGFGKAQLDEPETLERVARYLPPKAQRG